MRLFIIGGEPENFSNHTALAIFCNEFGKRLGKEKIDLILCSPFKGSADYDVIQGLKTTERDIKLSLTLYYPRTNDIEVAWNKELKGLMSKVVVNRFYQEVPSVSSKESFTYSWLFCQLQAIAEADIVVVVGGKISGSSNLLVRIANAQGKTIVPIPTFGGVGELYYRKMEYQLRDVWDDKDRLDYFETANATGLAQLILHKTKRKVFKALEGPKERITFFISYARQRPAEADYIEMLLRQRNRIIIRDEQDIEPGDDINNAIKENISRADIFIAVWCKEYACSPWCYDELSQALELHKRKGKPIWIFCVDDTRMIHPEARKIVQLKTETRKEIKGEILELLRKL